MERQNSQSQVASASDDIEVTPPAYSPKPPAEGLEDVNLAADQPAGPVKDLPANFDTPQQQLPMTPHHPVAGVTPLNQLGDRPQWIDCPFCKRRTLTRLDKDGTPMQIVAGVLCCLLCVCLACVPCLAHWFEETTYVCSQCHKKVAKRPESGPIIVYGPEAVVPSKYA